MRLRSVSRINTDTRSSAMAAQPSQSWSSAMLIKAKAKPATANPTRREFKS